MRTLQAIADDWLEANPGFAIFLGISRLYGKVFDYSPGNFSLRVTQLEDDMDWVQNYLTELDRSDKVAYMEALVVDMRLKQEYFAKTDIKYHEIYPTVYLYALGSIQGVYTARSYAPIDKRIEHIISTQRTVINNLKLAPDYLKDELAKVRIEMTFLQLNAYLGYFKDKLIEFVAQSETDQLVEEWSTTNEELVNALEQYKSLLTDTYLPRASDEFALGSDLYGKILKNNELLEFSNDELLEVANKDLERNYQTLQGILADKGEDYLDEFFNDYPKPEMLYEEARLSTERAKQFVIEKDLATIAEDSQVQIKETPDAMRPFTFAAMNPSGIGEDTEADESYYYITSPDADWDDERTKEFMSKSFARGALETITIHEVWPGHFHHTLWIKKLESKILRQLAFSTTTLEGWAHYTEELAIEQGYDLYDPTKVHVGQLQWALVRNCRFVSSVKMHTMGMTVEESKDLFMEKAMLAEDAALKEARRGTMNPEYLNYTLGKLMILKLREDYRKEKGDEFSLKDFHDSFMQYGSPPVALLREILLENPGDKTDIL